MYKLLIVLAFSIVGLVFYNAEVTMSQVEYMVNKQIPNIAHKSYLNGCLENSNYTDCHSKADKYRQDLVEFMESVGTD